ncbi:MAG TPA: hypothetical protein DEF34_03240 [Desulfotomaculum sp.]|nr:MAG: hypothetical protein JL56_02860 [Desulfotomaculum sp. BICA1-6]HBX22642.1 hypothetical protein [Desulfotomaculum sp.]
MSDKCINQFMSGVTAEIERLNKENKELLAERDELRAKLLPLGSPSSFQLWRGECGHVWRKDQADNCPICERDALRKAVEAAREYKDEIGPDFESEKRYTLCRALGDLAALDGDT